MMESKTGRRMNATINVSVQIDRNLLIPADSNAPKKISIEKKLEIVTRPQLTKGQNGIGMRKFDTPDQQTKVPIVSNAKSDDNQVQRTGTISNVGQGKMEKSMIPTDYISTDAKSQRTPPFDSVPSDDCTRRVWFVDKEGDQIGVKPNLNSTDSINNHQEKNGSRSQEKRSKTISMGNEKLCHGKLCRDDCNCEKCTNLKDKPMFNIWKSLLPLMMLIMAVAYFPFGIHCRIVKTFVATFDQFGWIVRDLGCEMINEMCQCHGWMCSNYCASGLQLELWKQERQC